MQIQFIQAILNTFRLIFIEMPNLSFLKVGSWYVPAGSIRCFFQRDLQFFSICFSSPQFINSYQFPPILTYSLTISVFPFPGKLKHAATVEFDAPIEYNVFCRITAENPEGVLLTKAIFMEMNV